MTPGYFEAMGISIVPGRAPTIASGLIASAAAARLLTNQLFGVTPGDPMTFAVVTVSRGVVALLASLIPATRAAAADPTAALRSQ